MICRVEFEMYRGRVLYPPQYVRGFTAAMLRAHRDLKRLSEDWRLEAEMIREEIREAKAELARLQTIEPARAAERDPLTPLQ
jgi:hypothetical protein